MASTLLLDRGPWDVALDAAGNLALATAPYSQIQDAASECRVFFGECYYDTTRGIRYLQQILGRPVPIAILKAQLATAAQRVPGVTKATPILSQTGRTVSGSVECLLDDGTTQTLSV